MKVKRPLPSLNISVITHSCPLELTGYSIYGIPNLTNIIHPPPLPFSLSHLLPLYPFNIKSSFGINHVSWRHMTSGFSFKLCIYLLNS